MDHLCIIPARGSSKRLPRKNILELDGKPIIQYTIEAARRSGLFKYVVVSTEDSEIAEIAKQCGADVPFVRPSRIAVDQSCVADVCVHAIKYFSEVKEEKFPIFCCLYPTSPLRSAEDILGVYQMFMDRNADGAMAVTSYDHSPFQAMVNDNQYLKMMWPEIGLKQSQEQPTAVVDNGSTYWMRTEIFLREQEWYPEKLVGYPMSWWKSIDVNYQEDFEKLMVVIEMLKKDRLK